MLKCINIPRGVANLFLPGLAIPASFNERTQYRPDKLMIDVGEDDMKVELMSNYLSILSPISAKKGKSEIFPDNLFQAYFGALNG